MDQWISEESQWTSSEQQWQPIITVVTISPVSVSHAHTIDESNVAQIQPITPISVIHDHTVSPPTLNRNIVIKPIDLSHSHTVSLSSVTPEFTVSPISALHQHYADITFFQIKMPDGYLPVSIAAPGYTYVQTGKAISSELNIESEVSDWVFLAIPYYVSRPDVDESLRRLEWDREFNDVVSVVVDGDIVGSTTNQEYNFSNPPGARKYLLVGLYKDGELPTAEDTAELDWTETTNHYFVKRLDPGSDWATVQIIQDKTKWLDRKLTDGEYSYKVVSEDEKDATKDSNVKSVTIDAPPQPPSDLSYEYDSDAGTIELTWTDSPTSGTTHKLRVYEGGSGVWINNTPTEIVSVEGTPYTYDVDDASLRHAFLLRAVDSSDIEEANIEELEVYVSAESQVYKPTEISAEAMADGYAQISGTYNALEESGLNSPGLAQELRIYSDGGSGDIDWSTLHDSIVLGKPTYPVTWDWDSSQLDDGVTYNFGLVAATDIYPDGDEGDRVTVSVTVDTSEPEATVLEVEVV